MKKAMRSTHRPNHGGFTRNLAGESRDLGRPALDYQKNCRRVSKIFGSSLRSPPRTALYLELETAT